MDTAIRAQELSKAVFNAQHRIGVAQAVVNADRILTYEEVAQQSGTSRSVAHKELQLLVRIGAVNRVELPRSVGYQTTKDSPFWPFLQHLSSIA